MGVDALMSTRRMTRGLASRMRGGIRFGKNLVG